MAPADLRRQLLEAGKRAGLDMVRITDASPFLETRRHLFERRAAGLHGGMNFTYRRPERSTDPAVALPGARSLVVGALSYGRGAGDTAGADGASAGQAGRSPTGRVARSAQCDEYAILRSGLAAISLQLKESGHRARVLADDNALVDRAAAHRAGIGWWGKNTLILIPGIGSWFVIGSVLTDAELPADEGPVADHCGSCFRCAAACPTGAIVAPGVLDARRCLSWLLEAADPIPHELREAVGDRIYGCDACQEVCPPNRVADSRQARLAPGSPQPVELRRRQSAAPPADLVWMVGASDEDLLSRFGHFYLAGRRAALLRRNALVALGNVGRAVDPAVREGVALGLRSPDELVRSHTVWAAGRLGLHDLAVEACAADDSEMVRQEVRRLPEARPGAA